MKFLKNAFIFLLICFSSSYVFAINPLISNVSISKSPLSPEEAFSPSIVSDYINSFNLNFDIKKGYHLYKDKIEIKISDNINIVSVIYPEAEKENDPNFGDVSVYKSPIFITYHTDNKKPSNYEVSLTYQGCADMGVCYPPVTQSFSVQPSSDNVLKLLDAESSKSNEHKVIVEKLKNDSLLINIVLFFIAGIGLSLTPCMLPMVPIISTIILGKHNKDNPLTHKKGFILSLFYVLGMSITYSIAGVFAGITGTLMSSILQNTYVLIFFASIFVFLAGGMLGLYSVQLPTVLQEYFAKKSANFKATSFVSIFLLGAISSLIVGPCVAAPLAGALLYIGQTGNGLLGGTLLFAMSLGMGVPLLIVGTSSGSFAIKTGNWMEEIKRLFGFILLATSVWILNPVIGDKVTMLLFGVILLYVSYDLKLYESLQKKITKFQQFSKVLGFFCLIIGVSYIVGSLGGSTSYLQPLSVFSTVKQVQTVDFKVVTNIRDLNEVIESSNKPIFVDFYAKWCVSCKEFDNDVLSDEIVLKKLENFTLVRADVTETNADTKELLSRYELFGPPALFFYSDKGVLLDKFSRVGSYDKTEFLRILDKILTKQPF